MTTATDTKPLIADIRKHVEKSAVWRLDDAQGVDGAIELTCEAEELLTRSIEALSSSAPQDGLLNPVHQVYFRAGLIACREYMARFVEAQDPAIAQSIRANWWPSLGPDLGPPRLMEFGELTEGEFDTPSFRCKTVDEVSPTLEALPVALIFLDSRAPAQSSPVPHEAKTVIEVSSEQFGRIWDRAVAGLKVSPQRERSR